MPGAEASPATPPSGSPERKSGAGARHALRVAIFLAAGGALLGVLIDQAGTERIGELFANLGPAGFLILLPYTVIAFFDALGWRCTLPPATRPPVGRLYLVRLAGEAVNELTPTAYLGGEPVKAQLLRRDGVPLADGLASVVIAKTALTVSQVAFILLGVAVLAARLARGPGAVLALLALAAGGTAFAVWLVRVQRRGLIRSLWRLLDRLAPRAAWVQRLEARALEIDSRLGSYYREQRGAFVAASALHMVGWLLGTLEVALVLYLLGTPLSLTDALAIEALHQPLTLAAAVIPGALGVREAGGMLLCQMFGVPEAPALTLWLIKRARETIFSVVGLAVLVRGWWPGRCLRAAGGGPELAVSAASPPEERPAELRERAESGHAR